MDAIILVGGQGARLRPLTLTRHKSLIPVANRPALEHLLDWLGRFGESSGRCSPWGRHQDDLVEAYPGGRPRRSDHDRARGGARAAGIGGRDPERRAGGGGGGAFSRAQRRRVRRTSTLGRRWRRTTSTEARLTLALCRVVGPVGVRGGGGGRGLADQRASSRSRPPGTAPSDLVNAGVWVFEPDLVGEIPPGAVRVEETLFPSLVGRRENVLGYRFEGLWADLGTPARYLELSRSLAQRVGAPLLAEGRGRWPMTQAALRVEASSVGAGSVGGSGGAYVTGSVLWEDVRRGSRRAGERLGAGGPRVRSGRGRWCAGRCWGGGRAWRRACTAAAG